MTCKPEIQVKETKNRYCRLKVGQRFLGFCSSCDLSFLGEAYGGINV